MSHKEAAAPGASPAVSRTGYAPLMGYAEELARAAVSFPVKKFKHHWQSFFDILLAVSRTTGTVRTVSP